MFGAEVATPLGSFLSDHENVVTAIVSFGAAVLIALVFDRWVMLRGERLARRLPGEVSPEVSTRLRFARRAVEATIILIGAFVAASQFEVLNRLATSLLASGALAAAVIGFAARQTLANVVAGILLAITQPLRIGDDVVFEGETGTVDDIRLSYTFLRTAGGSRIVIPNERLAAGVLRNDTVIEPVVATEVDLWLPREADALAALAAIEAAVPDVTAQVAEVAADGTRMRVTGPKGAPATRGAREAELRAAALGALQGAGLR